MPGTVETAVESGQNVTDDRTIEELLATGDPQDNKRAIAMMHEQLEDEDMDVPPSDEFIDISDQTEELLADPAAIQLPVDPAAAQPQLDPADQPPVESVIDLSQAEPVLADPNAVPSSPAPVEPADPAVSDKGTLSINYGGEVKQLDDSDGFLGRGSLDGLKKARAHQNFYIEDLKGDLGEAQNMIRQLQADNAALQRRIQEQPAMPAQSAMPASGQPASSAQSQQTPIGTGDPAVSEPPVVPLRPELPADPLDWTPEHTQQFHDYNKARDEYDLKFREYILNRPAHDPRVDQLSQTVEQYKTPYQQLLEQNEKKKAEDADKAYWDDFDNFRNTHPDYKIRADVDTKTLHHEVHVWMDQLARAMGKALPVGANQQEIDAYESTKAQVAKSYLDGDPNYTATGLQPPAGYDEYFKLGELMALRNSFVEQKKLGERATLHDAYVYHQDQSGSLDAGMNELQLRSRQEGVQNVLSAARQHQQFDAVTIPPNANAVPPVGQGPDGQPGFTDEEYNRAMTATPIELDQSPALRELKKRIMSQVSF